MPPCFHFCTFHGSILCLATCREAIVAIAKCLFNMQIIFSRKQSRDKRLRKRLWPSSKLPKIVWIVDLFPEKSYHQRSLQIIRARCGGGNSRVSLGSESTLCSMVSARPSKHLFAKHLLFHLHVSLFPALWSPKTPPSRFSLVFNWK